MAGFGFRLSSAAAALVPLAVVLTIGLWGIAMLALWLLLTGLFWLILAECLPKGRWGRSEILGTIAGSSLLAALIVVGVLGR